MHAVIFMVLTSSLKENCWNDIWNYKWKQKIKIQYKNVNEESIAINGKYSSFVKINTFDIYNSYMKDIIPMLYNELSLSCHGKVPKDKL